MTLSSQCFFLMWILEHWFMKMPPKFWWILYVILHYCCSWYMLNIWGYGLLIFYIAILIHVYCECRCSLLKFRIYIYHLGQRAKCKPIEMISNPMAVQDISVGTMHCQHDTQIVIPYSYIKAHSKPMTCVKVKQDYTQKWWYLCINMKVRQIVCCSVYMNM